MKKGLDKEGKDNKVSYFVSIRLQGSRYRDRDRREDPRPRCMISGFKVILEFGCFRFRFEKKRDGGRRVDKGDSII